MSIQAKRKSRFSIITKDERVAVAAVDSFGNWNIVRNGTRAKRAEWKTEDGAAMALARIARLSQTAASGLKIVEVAVDL